jgi:PAS domain S-box-containing protein
MVKKHSSIQQKLATAMTTTSASVLLMTCSIFFIYEFITARETARRQLSTLARIVAMNSTAALAFQSKEDATETLNSLRAEKHIQAACLFDTSGHLFAKYPAQLTDDAVPQQPFSAGYQFSETYLVGFEPVLLDGKIIGTLYLKADRREMYERFLLYGGIAIIFMVIAFLFAYIISKRLQRSIANPLIELANTARKISDEGNYSVRAIKRNEDEVGDLTDAFNHMLTRIEIQNVEITGLNQNLEQKVKERTKEMEEAYAALKQQTELTEKILDSTVDLIAVFDTEFRYVTMNKQFEGIYGRKREELYNKRISDVYPQVVQSGMLDDLKQALKGEIVKHQNYHSPITKRHYESFYIPLKDEDVVVYGILTVSHDVTDMTQANEKLQRLNADLEKSNSDLEQFAYVASHDLQEPLRKIQTFSELSERNLDNKEQLKKYLAKVSSSAYRMTELIKAVLNYSRLVKNENLAFAEVDLNSILNSILSDLELMIEEKNAIISVDRLPVVQGIALQLHQLFLNLLSNSLKFTERRPEIKITSELVKENGSVAYLLLTLCDNGIGFDQKFEEKIFSIFQRLHHDKNIPGTGIGLALCKKIVENHRGRISVKSEVNKGTSFYIYLPA